MFQLTDIVQGNLLSLIRYVGLSPRSSNVRQILLGISTQLALAIGCSADSVPTEYKDLQRFFPELINSIPMEYTVVIILDGLEQVCTYICVY